MIANGNCPSRPLVPPYTVKCLDCNRTGSWDTWDTEGGLEREVVRCAVGGRSANERGPIDGVVVPEVLDNEVFDERGAAEPAIDRDIGVARDGKT